MATLIFSAVGTMVGGPLGGSIGALIGNQVDRAVIGGRRRNGPRLRDLSVSTSSYGTPIPRHFGRIRTAGTIIWSTDLKESTQRTGGGKGRPSVNQYSYSASFAVALSSRPIRRLGRVWADGTLLRGEGGDLKVGGTLRIHDGSGAQQPDPLIAADRGGACPAFRGIAYCVFENLQLGDFGNRIPALTFEVIADEEAFTLADVVGSMPAAVEADRPLSGLQGYSDTGGPVANTVASIGEVYPVGCDCSGPTLSLFAAEAVPDGDLPILPPPARDAENETFGRASGEQARRLGSQSSAPAGLRYYDVERDFQAGLQRAGGQARPGREEITEFPGALHAADARALAEAAAERASWSREAVLWRVAELDPALRPGTVVRLPGKPGRWRIASWEWQKTGVELELQRVPHVPTRRGSADPGTAASARDLLQGPTVLAAFDLPSWSPSGSDRRRIFAAASSPAPGWKGASLHAVDSFGLMEEVGATGSRRASVGTLLQPLPPSAALLFETSASIDVQVPEGTGDFRQVTVEELASGANRALCGEEILQFATAEPLGSGAWRLGGLLRGRGGTEIAAQAGTPEGAPFVLLDDAVTPIDAERFGNAVALAAIGLADAEPVVAPVINPRIGLVPPSPVHPRATLAADGSILLSWTRRARGAWGWDDLVDVPMTEAGERYLAGIGDPDRPAAYWETGEAQLLLSAATRQDLAAAHPGATLWVRQVGSHAMSAPLRLLTL